MVSEEQEAMFIPSDNFVMDERIRKGEIGIGDEVLITGLFTHSSGTMKNTPILRVGNIAMLEGDRVPTR